ncbi:MAG: hypothetical protein ACLQBD_06450 [Syntrophobacteraceae bacterium]
MELTKQRRSIVGLKRFGICALTTLITVVWVSAATNFKIRFYFPIGISILSLYSWIIANKLKKTYPLPSRAIGQLLLVFLITGFSQKIQFNRVAKLVESGQFQYIYSAAEYHAYATVAGAMVWILLVYYLVIKYKDRRRRQYDVQPEGNGR